MILEVQIKTLIFSFLFGIYFAYMIRVNYKYIYTLKKLYKILATFLLIFSNVLLYFIILLKINNGIIHMYSLLMIVLGTYMEHFINRIIEKNIKK